MGNVGLQVEGCGFGRPLLVVGQLSEAGSERVGYAELHGSLEPYRPLRAAAR